MIVYNMRYRGPYEYDKLVLNVFQYHNEVADLVTAMNENDSKLQELGDQIKTMNKQIESINNQMLVFKERALER